MGKLLNLIAVLLLLTSCSSTGCLENQSSLPLAGFYSSRTQEGIAIDSLQVWGVGAPGDSMLVDGVARNTYLPLRSSMEIASFCFHYDQKELSSPLLNDTITLSYSSQPRFVSEECGAMYFYEIKTLHHTCHLIDSVVLVQPEVNNIDRETMRIYFRTAEPVDDGEDDNDDDETGDTGADQDTETEQS